MAALGQPVPAEPAPMYAPSFQQPLQGMYQDPYSAAQAYGGAGYAQAPLYQDFPVGMYAGNAPLAGALQWEMPQVRSLLTSLLQTLMWHYETHL